MTTKKNLLGTFVGCILLCSWQIASQTAIGKETYIYEESDGTRWITDRPMLGSNWKFIDKFGRPTASKSCSGVTAQILERRFKRYEKTIRAKAKKYDIDVLLLKALIRVESCFDRRAISRAGAEGLMQLMPQTAKSLGVSNSFNADQNIEGGTRYLRKMLSRFNDLQLALAAYNAGPHNVNKYGGIPPFKETRNYVKRINFHYENYLRSNIGLQPKPY